MPSKKTTTKTAPRSKVVKAPKAPATTELLVEIGTEELPYQFVAPAMRALQQGAETLLKDLRLTYGAVRTMGTPRRLVLLVEGLATQQASAVKEAMGPSKSVAFDQNGQPTRAAVGFAAGQGIPVEDLQVRQTPKGEYLFAVKQEKGQAVAAVLTQALPQLLAKLSFPKAMQWNQTGVRFARPMRWQSPADSVRDDQGRQFQSGTSGAGRQGVRSEGFCRQVHRALFEGDRTPQRHRGSGSAASHDPRPIGLAGQVCARASAPGRRIAGTGYIYGGMSADDSGFL
jgi:hypothetical protein